MSAETGGAHRARPPSTPMSRFSEKAKACGRPTSSYPSRKTRLLEVSSLGELGDDRSTRRLYPLRGHMSDLRQMEHKGIGECFPLAHPHEDLSWPLLSQIQQNSRLLMDCVWKEYATNTTELIESKVRTSSSDRNIDVIVNPSPSCSRLSFGSSCSITKFLRRRTDKSFDKGPIYVCDLAANVAMATTVAAVLEELVLLVRDH